jgi:pilus assembly protein CpaB
MKARGMALVMAVLLAAGATAAVFLYVRSVKNDASTQATDLVTVVVPKQDIPSGTRLDDVIAAGQFTTQQVPPDAVVQGAATDLTQLQHRTTSTFILAGEQITAARLRGSTTATGGVLGIPPEHEALTIQLEPQRVPGQVVQPGDHVSVYATFDDVELIQGSALLAFVRGNAEGSSEKQEVGDFTVKLVPDAQVLGVSGQAGIDQGLANEGIMVTLALTPEDAQLLVFAREKGTVWLGLLPPGEKGQPQLPVSYLSGLRAAVAALAGEAK